MSTPYWGKLPSPKIVKNRRMSDDGDPQSSLDARGPPPAAGRDSYNRASVQTAFTEATTERTFSPSFESPTASAFTSHGLAPRPPSYQRPRPYDPSEAKRDARGASAYQSQHQRRRDFSPTDEIDADGEDFSPSPVLAPEQARGHSVSNRRPQGNSNGNGHPSHTQRGVAFDDRPTHHESNLHQERYEDEEDMEEPLSHGHMDQHVPRQRGHGDSVPREPPISGSGRRKKSTMPKSPLQRLELTLDSMTKEEKRARIEAAERRARERLARDAGDVPASTSTHTYQPQQQQPHQQPAPRSISQSHSQQAPTTGGYSDSRPTYAAAPAPAPVAQPLPRETHQYPPARAQAQATTSRAPPDPHQYRQYDDEEDEEDYGAVIPPTREEQQQQQQQQARVAHSREVQHELPKRNLSFRERAARDDIQFPNADEANVSAQEPAPKKGFGFSLTRSGSNKLKKAPRGDHWYQFRSREPEQPQREIPQHGAAAFDAQRPRDDVPHYPPQEKGGYHEPTHAVPSHTAAYTRRQSVAAPAVDRAPPAPQAAPEDIRPVQRRATEPNRNQKQEDNPYFAPIPRARHGKLDPRDGEPPTPAIAAEQRKAERQEQDDSHGEPQQHHISNLLYNRREKMQPGDGLYKAPVWLDEWKRATVGKLSGSLIDLSEEPLPSTDKNKAWWEQNGRRKSSTYPSQSKAQDAYESEYDHGSGPTRFNPQLYLECGPLLRYCGIRQEKVPARTRGAPATTQEMWRGTVMIVTRDVISSYEVPPTLRLFIQDLELLPAPPHQVNGDLSPEYVDPIAGHPKLGRQGETLYVRPVDHLEEGKDISQDETDSGLFETTRSGPDVLPPDGSADWPGTFTSRMKRVEVDGEKQQKFKDVKAFRLHTENGFTFWRFNIEVELSDRQQRIAYRINKGPSMSFWVPAKETSMNVMFHSCNGFSIGTKSDALSGPDPMWRDVLNTHQTSPFHVMIGGGDQIYNDLVADECDLLIEWLETRNPLQKHNAPLTPEMQRQLENFYFLRYCTWFSHGLFSLASSQIPMVNIWSDRESFNGFGSFPHRDMNSPVLSGLGAVAFKYYMLFQHQSIIPETEVTEPSWVLGTQPGPYVNELARSVYVSLGSKMALLAADCRSDRTEDDVIHHKTWERIMNRLYAEVRRGQVEHLLVVFPVPIAYPRLAWLENVLKSRAMNPVKALGRKGLLGNALNNLDNGSEVLDDLRDHWTAKNHKEERQIVIEDLQDLAIDKSLRITVLSGDVNLAAVGQFYSNPKLKLPKHKDPRYIPNIISSSIVNAPPPDIMVDALNKRHKIHHFDNQTDEAMIPLFQHGVDGKPRNNKRLLPHRNWCSIREWQPGTTPPPTPPPVQDYDESPSPPPTSGKGGLLRRLSLGSSERPNLSRDSVRGPRPPVSGGGGLFRSISRRLSRGGGDGERPAKLTRSMSWGRGDSQAQAQAQAQAPVQAQGPGQFQDQAAKPPKRSFFGSFRRKGSRSQPDDGGINGEWGGPESDYGDDYDDEYVSQRPQASGLRGGAAYEEYSDGDDSYFTATGQTPQRSNTVGATPTGYFGGRGPQGANQDEDIPPQALRPFHRTPTGLSTKQMKKADRFEVDLEGGLDICLNVEVNPRDPTGITVPYRLLVPKLFYEYTPETDDILTAEEPSKFKRFLSLRKKDRRPATPEDEDEEGEEYDDQGYDDGRQPQQQQPQQYQQQQYQQQQYQQQQYQQQQQPQPQPQPPRGNGRFFGRG